jgi:hypothetical protein
VFAQPMSGTYTVKKDGSGDFTSLVAATNRLQTSGLAGRCSIVVYSGVYNDGIISLQNVPGASTYQTFIIAPPGEMATLMGGTNSYTFQVYNTNNVKIKNFNITGPTGGSYVIYNGSGSCNNWRFEGCTFNQGNASQECFYWWNSSNDTIWGCTFNWGGNSQAVLDLTNNGPYIVINNFIVGSNNTYSGIWFRTTSGSIAYHNTIYVPNNNIASSYAIWASNSTIVRDNIIYNANAGANAIGIYVTNGTFNSNYNDIYCPNNTNGYVGYHYTYGWLTWANWYLGGTRFDTSGINVNPQIGGPLNLHLRDVSPCINAGGAGPGIVVDIDGDARPYGSFVDIGADEWANNNGPAMSGIYHIKPGVNRADTFPSFDATFGAFQLRGQSGSVTFHVMPGTYGGALNFTGFMPTAPYWVTYQQDDGGGTPIIDAGGAAYGITLLANNRLRFKGLTIQNFTSWGIFGNYVTTPAIKGTDTITIWGCTITGPNGILLQNLANVDTIYGNKIVAGTSYGIQITNYTSNVNYYNFIANNFISGTFTSYGLYVGQSYNPSSQYLKVYNNTIHSWNSSSVYLYYPSNMDFRNNIVKCGGTNSGYYAMYYYAGTGNTFDYNCYQDSLYANGWVYNGSAYAWASWRTNVAGENNSYNQNPGIAGQYNLHLKPGSVCYNTGATIASVPDDIDGDARPNGAAYDIGADEYTVAPPLPMNGIYTIKQAGGGDYLSFSQALGDIQLRGQNGTITFDVYSGTYFERLDLSWLTNGAYWVNFIGHTGNLVTLNAGASGQHAVYMKANKHIRFERINVTNWTSGNYAYYLDANTSVVPWVGCDTVVIKGCKIDNGWPSSGSSCNGIFLGYTAYDDTIWGCDVRTGFTGNYAIYLQGNTSYYSQRNIIANNFIHLTSSYGIYVSSGCDTTRMYYNSITGYNWSSPTNVYDAGRNTVFMNNAIQHPPSGSYYIYNKAGGTFLGPQYVDYNCETSGVATPYYSGGYINWTAWRALGYDAHSKFRQPGFASTVPSNLHITSLASPCVAAGTAIPGITTDYDGDARGSNPCIGADEIPYDIATRGIIAPTGMLAAGSSVTPTASFKYLVGPSPATFKVFFRIVRKTGGATVYQDSSGLLVKSPGDSFANFFSPWTASPPDSFYTTAWCRVVDGNSVNDTARSGFKVSNIDCAVTQIIVPTGDYHRDTIIRPRVRISNLGDATAVIRMTFTIDNGLDRGKPASGGLISVKGPGSNSVGIGEKKLSAGLQKARADATVFYENRYFALAAGRDTNFTLAGSFVCDPVGDYTAACSIYVAGDQNPGNDSLSQVFHVIPPTIHDVGVTAVKAPLGNFDSSQTFTPACSVYNYGGFTEGPYNVRMKIGNLYNLTTSVPSHASGSRIYVTFPTWTARERGLNAITCSTELNGDAQTSNDLASATVLVRVHDGAVISIDNPTGGVPPAPLTPRATVRNLGTAREPVTAYFVITGAGTYSALPISLPGGLPSVDTQLSFTPNWTATVGSWTAKCSLGQAGDQFISNNRVTLPFQVGTVDAAVLNITAPPGIVDSTQAIDPAGVVRNNGSIPTTFKVFFRIADALDAVVYSESTTVTNLAPGSQTPVTFPTWAKPHAPGNYATLCSAYVAFDNSRSNDAVRGTLTITVPSPLPVGWTEMVSLPPGGKAKNVKDGGALTYGKEGTDANDTGYVYAFKGNNRYEFYRFNTISNAWISRESIPAIGSSSKKKAVKKGSTLVMAGDGKVYGAKGNGTLEWWQFNPVANTWTEKASVLSGAKALKEGVSSAAVTIGSDKYVYLLRGSGTWDFMRYKTGTDAWETRAPAPGGVSTKAYKNGSSICYDGSDTIYCLKGSTNEFAAYSVSGDNWVSKDPLPLVAPPGTKKKKVKDGSQIASDRNQLVYALKGGGTDEFWTYNTSDDKWYTATEMTAGARKVKAGGALTYADNDRVLYAFRGNNTLQFWCYNPGTPFFTPATKYEGVMGGAQAGTSSRLAVAPNPFTSAAAIRYSLSKPGNISLKLYDISGKLVTTLAGGYATSGSHTAHLDARNLASGIYLLKFESNGYTTTEKLIIE